MTYAALAALQAATDTDDGTIEFSGWIILLLFSAIFWMLVARSLKKRLDAMGELPDAANDDPAQGVSSSDE